MDSDGDLDVLARASNADRIVWYKNDGSGSFGPEFIVGEDFALSVHAADVDGDGHQDVLSANGKAIAWYKNDGRQNFERNLITDMAEGARFVTAADLDGDGDLDVLWTGTNKTAWQKNTNGRGDFQPPRTISNELGDHIEARAADLDGDGDLDVVSGTERGLAWFENEQLAGQAAIAKRHGIWGASISSLSLADIDGDDDIDVIAQSRQRASVIAIIFNANGAGAFDLLREIDVQRADDESVYVADLDGDGDSDIVAAWGSPLHIVAWYENKGKEGFGPQHVVRQLFASREHVDVYAADLDGDADVDLLSSFSVEIRWYENRVHGDSSDDGIFDSGDFVRVFQAGKYETGHQATYEEGDWNGDDQFTTEDLVLVFQEGIYEKQVRDLPCSSSLVSWWPGDGNAQDLIGDNDGNPQGGAAFARGLVAQAFSLDGVDDFIEIPDSPASGLDGMATITVDAWVFPTGGDARYRAVVTKYDTLPPGEAEEQLSYGVWLAPGGEVKVVFYDDRDDGPSFTGGETTAADVPLNAWSHIAATWDGASLRIYINGIEQGYTNLSSGNFTHVRDTSTAVRIGADSSEGHGGLGNFFPGLIDEVDVFDRALSPAEVRFIFIAGTARRRP